MLRRASIVFAATILTIACASSNPDDENQKAKRGAGIGAAAGAVVGAVIGNQSGNPRTGAAVGAAIGAAAGGVIGHRMDQQQAELQQIPGVDDALVDVDRKEVRVRYRPDTAAPVDFVTAIERVGYPAKLQ